MSLDTETEARFDKIDTQLSGVDKRFDKLDKQLDTLTMAMLKGFDRIDAALETKASKADMERVLGLLDELTKRSEISDDERLVMGHQLDRLDRWTHELASKIGYELSA